MKYSVGKPIHQSIGNFTAHLLVYWFVEWKFLGKKIWRYKLTQNLLIDLLTE